MDHSQADAADRGPRVAALAEHALARMPHAARRTYAAAVAAPRHRDTARDVETADEARQRAAAAHAHRVAQWEARCPVMFAGARIADLDRKDQHRDRLMAWLDNCHRTLVLHSQEPGTGKTHAAYALGRAGLDRGMWALAYTVTAFNRALRPDGDPGAWDVATCCDLLVLDDLGRERDTDWSQEQLHEVLDVRTAARRRTIITTNLAWQEMVDRYGDPVAQRIIDDAVVVGFTGASRRAPAPW